MRPIATNAAAALAAEHPEVDLSALLNHCTAPYLGVAAVQADVDRLKHEAERKRKLDECQTMSHNALRSELKALGVRNSFDGSTTQCLRSLFCAALQQDNADGCSSSDAVPPQLRRAPELRRHRRQQYDALIEGITLRQLGVCLPDEQWEHYCACGWLKMSLALSKKERRMIALCHRVALCELGVDPTDRATFENAKHVVGYDYTWGWLRAPANSQAQLYLATHPTLYRLYVGLYAACCSGASGTRRHRGRGPGRALLPRAAPAAVQHEDCAPQRRRAQVLLAPRLRLAARRLHGDARAAVPRCDLAAARRLDARLLRALCRCRGRGAAPRARGGRTGRGATA